MAAKKQVKLPEKPSALIRLALRDLEKVERSRRYVVDMSVYHVPNGHCRVCFAGSVMAYTLKVARDFNSVATYQLPERGKMNALDCARRGDVGSMFEYLGRSMPKKIEPYFDVRPYDEDKKGFKRDMRKLAATLARAGA